MNQKYYIGLDIGTNSVGWAVTDPQYNLIKAPVKGKYKNHDMWGIRLFESGNTAEERRLARCNRRRLQRRVNRIHMLQELFAEEITKVDPTFFIRLNDSRLHVEDKHEVINKDKHPLFIEDPNAEAEYYKKYPTIYHLRKELIENPEPHDIRLVYLALHHIIKYRGHFLREGDLTSATDFDAPFNILLNSFNDLNIGLICTDKYEVKKILSDNTLNNSSKQNRLKDLFSIEITDELLLKDSKDIIKQNKNIIAELTKLLSGNKGAINKIFENVPEDIDGTKMSIKLSESKYEEEIKDILSVEYADEVGCIDAIKQLYDWSVLQEILPNGIKYLSDAKVNSYNEHKKNLELLKNIFKKYFTTKDYNNYFKKPSDKNDNYVSYVGFYEVKGKKTKVKSCSEDEFYTALKKKLDIVKPEAENNNDEIFKDVYDKVDKHSLLPMQRTKDNGVIPRQVHEAELVAILNNASKYLSFLNKEDEAAVSLKDKTVQGKIISIFEYKIPYYVGPLSTRHQNEKAGRQVGSNTWIVRKSGMENQKIYPWNFENVVDLHKSNEEFIERMTNKCTYLIGEDVLPKNSLLYKKYMVLNELNNLKIKGKEATVEIKQSIYNDLFKTRNKVTGKILLNYLQKSGNFNNDELTIEDLSGFDGNFANNLSSYLDFKNKVFDKQELTDIQIKAVEEIIKLITIYGDDSKMIGEMVINRYGDMFSNDQITAIKRLRYSGWGNFSNKFLTGIHTDAKDGYGTAWSIIDAMWNTNNNLMQLLSSKFDYLDEIRFYNAEHTNEIKSVSYENLVQDLYVSPANKRAIWQTIQIVEEIQKIMGCPADKIFVEMARGGEKEKKRTTSRKQHLIDLYSKCDKDVREWALTDINSRDERQFNSMKLYLYYTQQGKCAYTGEPINLHDLMSANSSWDRDHIYPQSRIKDDSIDNLVLVNKTFNAKKSNELLSADVRQTMQPTWQMWLEKGFISKKKYDRLTRKDDFTNDELSGFIARQLVETRQSTKVVADLMQTLYKKNGTKIVYVKAELASSFRKYPLNVLKSRRVNDYHHAKDAYLNIVVGDVYNTKYTDNPYKWIKENRDKTEYSITKTMCWDVYDTNGNIVWKGCDKEKYLGDDGKNHYHYITTEDEFIPNQMNITGGDIDRIREIVRRDSCMYTEYTYCAHGVLYNATHEKKGSTSATIPLKGNLSIENYGGYKSANTSYFAEVEFDGKKENRVKNIIGVPIYISNMLEHNPNAFIEYCENKGMKNVKVLVPMIKKNSLIVVNGFPMRIRGENDKNNIFKNNCQLKVMPLFENIIRRIEKYLEKNHQYVIEDRDGINDEMLMQLYELFINKLNSSYYINRIGNQAEKLKMAYDKFSQLTLHDKCYVLNNILTLLRCDIATSADLSLIACSGNAGKMDANKNTMGSADLQIVNQSVTGLFENRTQL